MSLFHSALSRRRPHPIQHHLLLWRRSFVEARVPWVRDRALDHAVEKEKNLRPLLALKNLIKCEPSKSIPISIASENRIPLSLPIRAADFIRNYPSIFQEFLPPGGSPARPHVRLTPQVLELDEDEDFIYNMTEQRTAAADRLLRLLMITRVNKLPLKLVDRLRWDLGLPHDYVKSLLTDYPDYFQISPIKKFGEAPTFALELVCWSDELAISAMERKAMKARRGEDEFGYKKGVPLKFPLQYSRGQELEKKVKKWIDDWQKLPYISPYEDASHLSSKSDQAEKWVVAVLHEVLHLLVSKKTDRDNLLILGEYLGLRAGFKRALVNHPGIFFTSNKISTHTVILREGYKRDLLVENHPLMGMRYRYIHLMNKVVEPVKPTGVVDTGREKKKNQPGEEDKEKGEEEEGDFVSDDEDVSDDEEIDKDKDEDEDEDEDDEEEDEDEDEDDDEIDYRQTIAGRRGRVARTSRNLQLHTEKMHLWSTDQASSNVRKPNMVDSRVRTNNSGRRGSHKGYGTSERSERSSPRPERSSYGSERSPRRNERPPGRMEGSSAIPERSYGKAERSPVNGSPRRMEGSTGRTERSPRRMEGSSVRTERSSGRTDRSPGKGSPGRMEGLQGRTERSPRRTEGPLGRTERSAGRTDRSSEKRSSARTERPPGRTDRSTTTRGKLVKDSA